MADRYVKVKIKVLKQEWFCSKRCDWKAPEVAGCGLFRKPLEIKGDKTYRCNECIENEVDNEY